MAKREQPSCHSRRLFFQRLMLLALAALPEWATAQPDETNWAVVDTAARTLTVYAAGGQRLAQYSDISIGSGGVAAIHYHGDHTTPRGNFRIIHIRPSRSFDTFYQLDYPTAEHAEAAMRNGRLTTENGEAIIAAARAGMPPPQTTVLGGLIGIHGVGRGSLRIHKAYNWTEGCVALANEQLHDFARFAVVGMQVTIR